MFNLVIILFAQDILIKKYLSILFRKKITFQYFWIFHKT